MFSEGFLSSDDDIAPGNYGLLDQIQAMKWVKHNIQVFGGDPDRVTIFGESAGGGSVGLHLFSNLSRGLFKNAIPQSGISTSPWAIYRPPYTTRDAIVAKAIQLNCSTASSSEMIACLRTMSPRELVEKKPLGPPMISVWAPRVDGHVIAATPEEMMQQGSFFPVPMMTGTTRNEDAGAASGIPNVEKGFNKSYYDSLVYGWSRRFGNYSNVVENAIKCEYPPSDDPTKNRESFIAFKSHYGYTSPHQIYAKVHTDKQPNVWMYLFDYVGKNDPEPKWKGAYHGIEMMYMFGAPFWESIPCPYTEDRCLSNWGKKQEWNDEDRRISLLTMRFWSNMAKYSDPRDGDTKWDRFDKTKERYLEITSKMSIKEHYLPEKMKFWKDTMPKMLRGEMKVHPRCAAASDTNTLIVSSFLFPLSILVICQTTVEMGIFTFF
ncbi:unnamed protein product [Owenia fusiformis]|uniref:Carboxylic ester hydrolase n=1 Tax=Owenia fusiformis TaxID=6347 RepID=A0A8S4N448_OWEFU|nr:unnamed protein product [Owenia fusiformis]